MGVYGIVVVGGVDFGGDFGGDYMVWVVGFVFCIIVILVWGDDFGYVKCLVV